ncbi:MAG: HNH endonuclease, partial [Dolichospermum sp.]
PLTGENVPLFHPRKQKWVDHFVWSADSIRVEGITTIGRATIVKLRMNNPVIIVARKRWVISGWHPPNDL